jgi:hypothetical protein
MTQTTELDELVLSEIERRAGADFIAAVLVGSAARGRARPSSDLDVLVISRAVLDVTGWEMPAVLDLHVQTPAHFLDAAARGDDFPSWATRYGRFVAGDERAWAQLVDQAFARRPWPDWVRKVEHARARLDLASDLLRLGDRRAAAEELRHAAAHVGRAVLLRAGVFPLSRPELASQLEARSPRLASDLRALDTARPSARRLREAHSRLAATLRRLACAAVAPSTPRNVPRSRRASSLAPSRAAGGRVTAHP